MGRLIKFYNLPQLSAGGFAYDFTNPKTAPDSEFHLLTKTGLSFTHSVTALFGAFDE